jgi:prolipoprotein diacylglyceryltransferase
MLSILNHITWDVSPFIYEGEHFAIGWYGTLVALAIIAVYFFQWLIYKKEKMPRGCTDIVFIFCTILGTLFCHIFHCWFYEWYETENGVLYNPTFHNPIEWLNIGHGMASHGVDFGMWLGALIVAKAIFKCSTLWILDRMIVSRLAFHAISRLANIFNSEIYGYPTDMPWGFLFVLRGETLPCHPTAIYESALAIVAIIIWWYLYEHTRAKQNIGLLTGISMLMLWIPRFFIEFLKPVQRLFEEQFVLNMGQMLSLIYILIGILLVIYALSGKSNSANSPQIKY